MALLRLRRQSGGEVLLDADCIEAIGPTEDIGAVVRSTSGKDYAVLETVEQIARACKGEISDCQP